MHKMGTDRHEFVIGKDTNGPWRLCLQSVKQSSGVFVGLLNTESRDDCISQSLIQRADNIFMSPSTWTGSYGWVLGENSQTCSNGKASPTPNYGTLGKQGDTIELQAISCQLRCPKRWESFTAFATIWSEIVNDYDTILTKRSKLAVFDCTVCIIQVTA